MNFIMKEKFRNIQLEYYNNLILKKSKFDSVYTCLNGYDENAHINYYCFMFTVHFKTINSGLLIQKQKLIKDDLEIIHKNISESIINSKAARNKKLQPFMLSFYDVECSRLNKSNLVHEVPHVHGVMLLHPKTAQNFEEIYKRNMRLTYNTMYAEKISFQAIDNGCEGVKTIIDYSLKYASNVFDTNINFELDYVFPDPAHGGYPFYAHLDKIEL